MRQQVAATARYSRFVEETIEGYYQLAPEKPIPLGSSVNKMAETIMAFFLERAGCRVHSVSCTDRYVNRMVELALNSGPWRFLMFNAFVRATKCEPGAPQA